MPRKFRLYVRKRQDHRGLEALVVTIPLSDVSTQHHRSTDVSTEYTQQPPTLTVSLPVSHFSALPVASLSQLHTRMLQLNLLPHGWSDITSSADQLSLCRMVTLGILSLQVNSNQRRLDTLTDLHGTPCHVWLVNITRSTWRRLSKCVFVLALSRALDPVGAPYSVRE